METYTSNNLVSAMTLDSLEDALCKTWAARFGHLPDSQKPRKGTFYLQKGKQVPPKPKALTGLTYISSVSLLYVLFNVLFEGKLLAGK